MSNYLTVAAITAAFQEIVQAALHDAVPGARVRVGPPRSVAAGEKEVNIYLYQVSPNAQARNHDLPTREADGTLVAEPCAEIRLHYLVSFAGDDHFATEIMLGRVVSVLHAFPVLTGAEIARIADPLGSYPFLTGSNLGTAREAVTFSPEYLTLEELSKLWTVFFQLAHRPSLQYVATPVSIDGDLGAVRRRFPRQVEIGIDMEERP